MARSEIDGGERHVDGILQQNTFSEWANIVRGNRRSGGAGWYLTFYKNERHSRTYANKRSNFQKL